MPNEAINTASDTANDGRTTDLRYRQRQFLSLHQWMTAHLVQLQAATQKDDGLTESEARYLFTLSLSDLRRNYDYLDLKKELQDEYSINRKHDNAGRRIAEEKVYVVPRQRLLMFNVLHVLYPCIAAGSCCVVELPTSAEHSVSALRNLFNSSLDKTAFRIVGQRPSVDVLSRFVVVDQIGTAPASALPRLIASEVDHVSVVVVDRTADLTLAANEVAKSRVAFSASQPYAPTYILVNEFVQETLLDLLQKRSSSSGESWNCSVALPGKSQNANMVFEDADCRVRKVSDRTQLWAHQENPDPKCVSFLSTSSHDDVIDALNAGEQAALLALYIFAKPLEAKYLAQFIRTHVSFVNRIPTHVLTWPATPRGYRFDQTSPYRREMFERPSPQFVNASWTDVSLETLHSLNPPKLQHHYLAATKLLNGTGQSREGDVNFFSQALLAGVICFVLPPIVGIVGGLTMVAKWRWKGS